MPTKLRKWTFWIDGKLLKALKELSRKTHIPASALARLGIKKILAEYQKKGIDK